MPPAKIGILPGSLPQEHYAAIGKVASNWSVFERIVDSAIWGLAYAEDEAAACLTAQFAGTPSRFNALIALVKLRGGSTTMVEKIEAFHKASNALVARRNRVIHDPWVLERSSLRPYRLEISAQKHLIFEYRPMDTRSVLAIAEDIANHINLFGDLINELIGEVHTLSEKLRPPS